MRLFLDSSVLLAASGSASGASREIFRRSADNGWTLIATPYLIDEVLDNVHDLGWEAVAAWAKLRPKLLLMDDILTLDRPAVFAPGKDRPILFGACSWADVLLTLDQSDFHGLLGEWFYGLHILTPGMFLKQERAAMRLV